LGEMHAELAAAPDFTPAALEALFADFVAARGLGLGAIVHAVRVAVSGKAVGFGLFDLLSILGRERVLARIDRALARLAAP
ncbi:MAG TPA: glutamate--tRNA ligase, partial [Thermoanaerobaculia bacterium]|nr:glutamate--tRNA ligase [Thermoanaerobaculia bacterium]